MRFSDIFQKSWDDFRGSFKTIFNSNFWFGFFPYLAGFLIIFLLMYFTGFFADFKDIIYLAANSTNHTLSNSTSNVDPNPTQMSALGIAFILKMFLAIGIGGIIMILAFFLGLYAYLCNFMVKKGESFKDLRARAKPLYWKFVGLFLLVYIILLGLALAGMFIMIPLFILSALIPHIGIIFGFLAYILVLLGILLFSSKLILSFPIMIYEGKKITESIKEAWILTKGNLWNIFGYFVILTLIISAIYAIFYLFSFISLSAFGLNGFEKLITDENITSSEFSSLIGNLLIILTVTYGLFYFIVYVFALPFVMLFTKNIYFELRKKPKK